MSKVLENSKIQDINTLRQNSNFPKLYISDVIEIGGVMLVGFKDQSYCAAINMASNDVFPRQISLNPIANEAILSMKSAPLGDKEVMVAGFNCINQLAGKRISSVLLKRAFDVDNFTNDVIVEVTTDGPVNQIYLNDELFVITWLHNDNKETHFRVIKNEGIPWTDSKENILAALTSKTLGSDKLSNVVITAIAAKGTSMVFGLNDGSFIAMDFAAGSKNAIPNIHKAGNVPVRGVYFVPVTSDTGASLRILSVNAAGEIIVWLPGDVKPMQQLNEEVTHVDLRQVGQDFVLLVGTKAGFMHTYTVTNGRVQPLGVIREFGTKTQNLTFPVLGACSLKVFSSNLCVMAAKSHGTIAVWKVGL